MKYGGSISNQLRSVDLPIVSDSECNAALAGVFDPQPIFATNLCAGDMSNGKRNVKWILKLIIISITYCYRWCRHLPRWLRRPSVYRHWSWCRPAWNHLVGTQLRICWTSWRLHPGILLHWLDFCQPIVRQSLVVFLNSFLQNKCITFDPKHNFVTYNTPMNVFGRRWSWS